MTITALPKRCADDFRAKIQADTILPKIFPKRNDSDALQCGSGLAKKNMLHSRPPSKGAYSRGVPDDMRLKFGLVLAILTVAGSPAAFAQANCSMPIPPAAPDGRTASQQQIAAAVTDAKNFIAQSDVYQNCLLDYVRTQKEQAAEALKDKDNKDKKPFDPYIETQIQKQIDSNQAAKVRTGAEINAAVNDFKLAHPK